MSIREDLARNRAVHARLFGGQSRRPPPPPPPATGGEEAFSGGNSFQLASPAGQPLAPFSPPAGGQAPDFPPPVAAQGGDDARLESLLRAFEREGRLRAQDLQGEE